MREALHSRGSPPCPSAGTEGRPEALPCKGGQARQARAPRAARGQQAGNMLIVQVTVPHGRHAGRTRLSCSSPAPLPAGRGWWRKQRPVGACAWLDPARFMGHRPGMPATILTVPRGYWGMQPWAPEGTAREALQGDGLPACSALMQRLADHQAPVRTAWGGGFCHSSRATPQKHHTQTH